MRRIMFVDDEPHVLDGLRRALRKYRDEWEMQFLLGGPAALAAVDQQPIDVLVTDMRMPEIDGAQLLTEVKKRLPDTIRIILSGHSDQEAILRSVSSAHQFLSKPCSPEVLQATIARACALRDRVRSDNIKKLISRGTAPSALPNSYSALLAELQTQEPDMSHIADLVSQDVGMACSLLRIVNSSFFGSRRHIESLAHAVRLVGLNLLRQLALSTGIFSNFERNPAMLAKAQESFEHSLLVSQAAKEIAELELTNDSASRDNSMIAGIVHDVGQLTLAESIKSEYERILELVNSDGGPISRIELQELGASHAEVGAYLLGLWGLPDDIVEAVAYHHCPQECSNSNFSPLTAVHLANALVNEHTGRGGIHDSTIDLDYLKRLGIEHRIPAWRGVVEAIVSQNVPV